jgi:EpsI family protein
MLLGVPGWDVLVPILQRLTTIMSGAATTAAGIQAEIGYDTIAIRSGVFLVEEGCAGMNYLMGGLTLGAFYAHLFVDRWQTKLKIVALAGATAIVGNWIRVTVLIFLGEATAMQSPYIEDHLWQGWAIFTALMVPTYLLALRMERRDRRRDDREGGAAESGPEDASARDEVGTVPSDHARLPHRTSRPALATAFAVIGPIVWMTGSVLPRGAELERDPGVFDIASAWSVDPAAAPDSWAPGFRGVDERAEWTVSVQGETVRAARHYFVDQRQGEELVQYGNAIAPDSLLLEERMFGPVGPSRRLVNEAVLRTDDDFRVAWYWYRVAGFDTPFRSKAKLLEILSFFRRTPAAELVTLTAVCEPDSCEQAARTLRLALSGPSVD